MDRPYAVKHLCFAAYVALVLSLALSIGRYTDLNLPPVGRLLQYNLERAGIDANRRTLPPEKDLARSNLSSPKPPHKNESPKPGLCVVA